MTTTDKTIKQAAVGDHDHTPRPAGSHARHQTLAMAVLVAAATAGCSHVPDPPPAPPPTAVNSPPPTPPLPATAVTPNVDQSDATAVSKAAMTIMWSYDTRTDAQQGQRAAYLRASAYFTPAYLARVINDIPTSPMPDDLVTHQARGQVTLTPRSPQDAGPDTAINADRVWAITVTPTGRDGWHGTPVTAYVYVDLTRPGPLQPWRVADVASH